MVSSLSRWVYVFMVFIYWSWMLRLTHLRYRLKNFTPYADIFKGWLNNMRSIVYASSSVILEGNIVKPKVKDRVLLIANHQSWLDILVLYAAYGVPLTFVLKRSLRWLPFLGRAFVLYRFPMVERNGARSEWEDPINYYIEHGFITPLVIFPEGTRYTDLKAKKSRYKGLLNPHVMGIEKILGHYDQVFDVTICYGSKNLSLHNLFSGKIPSIKLIARDVTVRLKSANNRRELYDAVKKIWAEKSTDKMNFDQVGCKSSSSS